MKDLQFEHTRKALVSKQKDLKRLGKGNIPNASSALSEDDIVVLYKKDLWARSVPKRQVSKDKQKHARKKTPDMCEK